MELVSRVVRQRGQAQAFVSLPRLRETRPCCPNSASICLWSGLDPELPSGAAPPPEVTLRPLPSPATGLPRLPVSPSLRAVPTTPADRNGCIRRLLPRSTRPSPNLRRVGVHIFTFEACSGFTRVRPARSLNRPRRPLSQGFSPAGYPTRPPVSYQIKPTTVWVDPSSTGVTRRRGALRIPCSFPV